MTIHSLEELREELAYRLNRAQIFGESYTLKTHDLEMLHDSLADENIHDGYLSEESVSNTQDDLERQIDELERETKDLRAKLLTANETIEALALGKAIPKKPRDLSNFPNVIPFRRT